MDQEVKNLLEENLRLSKENNELLLKVRNMLRWAQFTRAFYWFIIIGVSVGAFYYIQPYFGNILNLYSGGVSGINNVGDITKSLKDKKIEVQDLLEVLSE